MDVLDIITLLIFLAALFTYINIRILKLPSTIGLMILALIMSITIVIGGYFYPPLSEGTKAIMMDFDFSEVLLHIMLSFLLFAGAMHINLRKLAEEKWPILILATVGTMIQTFLIGSGMFYVFQWLGMDVQYIYCLLFGALISPTDPIAVLSMVKKIKMSKNLEIKIAGESLFNDGVGVVIFLTILHVATSGAGTIDPISVIGLFGREVLGGILFGMTIGFFGFKLLKAIENEHVELEVLITLSMVMAGTQIAEFLEISGPLAMVVMGLFIGNQGRSEELANITGDYVFKFWHLVDEAMNAILFILIGLEMIVISENFRMDHFMAGLIAIAMVLLARLISVSIPITILSFWRKFSEGTIKILTWGGLRGGISVALALSLPAFEAKDLIVTITYCVVVFSILVQGLTLKKILKTEPDDSD